MATQKYCNDNHEAQVIWRKGNDCPLCLANLNLVEESDIKEDVVEDNVLELFKITDRHTQDLSLLKKQLGDMMSTQALKQPTDLAGEVVWAEF